MSIVESLVAAGVFVHSQSTLYPEHNGNPDQSARTVPLPAAAAVTQLGFEPLSFLLQCDTGSVPKHISTSREQYPTWQRALESAMCYISSVQRQ